VSARSLASALELNQADERRRALRALLMRPLLSAKDEEFMLVRRHADALRLWLARELGWTLLVEQSSARLFKRPADLLDGTRGAAGFDRRRYVLLCLSCSVLERSEAQITLQNLGDELMRAAAEPDLTGRGFSFTLDHASERRDLVHVCRFLIDCGALAQVAGDEEAFVSRAGTRGSDALYDVHRRVLANLLACVRGPSTFAPGSAPEQLEGRLATLVDEYVPEGVEGQRTAIRHRLARRLLDDPVVYFDELSDGEREYFVNQRGLLAARLAEACDLQPELRAEGAALIDPDGELSDARLPAEGTLSHATLLVAEYLAKQLAGGGARFVPETEVAIFLRSAADTYGRFWRKAEREPGAEHALARAALGQLHKLKLIALRDGTVRARPALARYGLGKPELREVQLSLHGDPRS
jgi:uncharacterized protein (TIGR02678 family)